MKLAEATKKQNDYMGNAISSLERTKTILMKYIEDKKKDDEATLQAVGDDFRDIKENSITTDNTYGVISQIDDLILALIQSNDDDEFYTDAEIDRETIYRKK